VAGNLRSMSSAEAAAAMAAAAEIPKAKAGDAFSS